MDGRGEERNEWLTSDAWTYHVWQPLIGIWDCKAEDRQFAGHQPAGHFFRGGKDSCTPRAEAGPNEKLMVPTCEICSLSVSVSRNGMLSLTQPQAKIGYARPAVSSPSAQNRSIFAVCDASQPIPLPSPDSPRLCAFQARRCPGSWSLNLLNFGRSRASVAMPCFHKPVRDRQFHPHKPYFGEFRGGPNREYF
jgi:hypothetical protein